MYDSFTCHCHFSHSSLLVCHGDPPGRDSVGPDLFSVGRLDGCLARGQGPARAAWLAVVELAAPAHGHFHDGDADKVGVLADFSLSHGSG